MSSRALCTSSFAMPHVKAIVLLQTCTINTNMHYQIQHKHNIQCNAKYLYLKIDMCHNYRQLTLTY